MLYEARKSIEDKIKSLTDSAFSVWIQNYHDHTTSRMYSSKPKISEMGEISILTSSDGDGFVGINTPKDCFKSNITADEYVVIKKEKFDELMRMLDPD